MDEQGTLQHFLEAVDERWSLERWYVCSTSSVNVLNKHACSAELRRAQAPSEAFDEDILRLETTLDRVMGVFRGALLRVRKCRNEIITINSLPVEILRQIFNLAGGSGYDHRTNMAIASLCTRWRAVALSDPCMWSSFNGDVKFLNYVNLATSRNADVPISILFNPRGPKYSQMASWNVKLAKRHIHRLSVLQVAFRLLNANNHLVHMDAPLLEHLSFHVALLESPCPLLRHTTPRLRTLELAGCRRPWISGMYANLTELSIRTDVSRTPITHDEDLMILFQESPLLESLELDLLSAPVPLAPILPNQPRIQMRHLKSLRIRMVATCLVQILHLLELPSSLVMFSASTPNIDDPTAVKTLFSPTCLPSASISQRRALKITYFGVSGEFFLNVDDEPGPHEPGMKSRLGSEVCIQVFCTFSSNSAQLFRTAVTSILEHPMPSVTRLKYFTMSDLQGRTPDDAAILPPLLSHVRQITALDLSIDCDAPTSTLMLQQLEQRVKSPLLHLAHLTLKLGSDFAADESLAEPILRLCSPHLKTLRVDRTVFNVPSLEAAAHILGALHSVPVVEWTQSWFTVSGSPETRYWPRQFWPQESYLWVCRESMNHDFIARGRRALCCGYTPPPAVSNGAHTGL